MRVALSVLVMCLLLAQSATAGAWLRDKGTMFLSFGSTLRKPNGTWQQEYGIYGEFGVTPHLTLGVDINDKPGLAGHLLVFARVPLARSWQKTRMAFELGIGANHYLGQWDGMVKTTLSVGRSFSSRWGPAWLSVDTALELRRPATRPALKLDATIGLSRGRRFRPMLQFQTTYISDKPLIWSVIPSLMIDGRKNATWVIGIEHTTADKSEPGLKFSLWRRF